MRVWRVLGTAAPLFGLIHGYDAPQNGPSFRAHKEGPPNYTGWSPERAQTGTVGVRRDRSGLLDNALSVFAEIETDILVGLGVLLYAYNMMCT